MKEFHLYYAINLKESQEKEECKSFINNQLAMVKCGSQESGPTSGTEATSAQTLTKEQTTEVSESLKQENIQRGKFHGLYSKILAHHEKTEKGKEKSLEYSAKRVETSAKKIQEAIDETDLKDYCDSDDYNEILGTTNSYIETAVDEIIYVAKNANLSPEFIRKLDNIKAQVLEKIETRKQELVRKHIEEARLL